MINKLLQNRIFACAAAVFCTLLWGTAFPFIKLGYAAFEVAESDMGTKLLFAGARFMLAGFMVYIALSVLDRKPAALKKTELAPVLALGLVQTAAQYLFTYIGIGFTSGTSTSIITACASFLTVAAAAFFFKGDRITLIKILGCALGFGGVLVINGSGFGQGDTFFGNAMIFCSTVCAAAGNIIAKKSANRVNPVKLTAFQLLIGSSVLVVIGLILGGRLNLANLKGMLILLWLAFVSAAAFTIWTALLKYHPAGKISVFNLLVPIFGTVLSGLTLGENIFNIETLISLILISAGIVLVNISKEKRRFL